MAEIHPVAVGEGNGVLELFGSGTGASLIPGWANNTGNGGVLVPVQRLDDILGNRFEGKRLLFVVDVEGVEDAMLAGAVKSLQRTPTPIWMVEINIDEHQPVGVSINPHLEATFESFWRHGYTAWTCAEQARRVEPAEIRAIVASGRSTIDTHNFIFTASAASPV